MTIDKSDNKVKMGNVTGSVVVVGNQNVVGDNNTVKLQNTAAIPPSAHTINLQVELAALRELLTTLQTGDNKLRRALDDAEEEAAKPEPDKAEVAEALERALTYAHKAVDFADKLQKLAPTTLAIITWLGEHGQKLMKMVNQ